jgi:hypothetical protein
VLKVAHFYEVVGIVEDMKAKLSKHTNLPAALHLFWARKLLEITWVDQAVRKLLAVDVAELPNEQWITLALLVQRHLQRVQKKIRDHHLFLAFAAPPYCTFPNDCSSRVTPTRPS